jgi:RNA polymerase sigma factor (sigma-70 family)
MTTDPRSLEVGDGTAGEATDIVRELQNLYAMLSDACSTDVLREERLRAIVAGADLGRRTRAPVRPAWRPYVLASLRRWFGSLWAWLAPRPWVAVVSPAGGPGDPRDEVSDAEWLESLWHDHRDDVVRFVARHVDDRAMVDDLTQQTFIAAWRQRKQIDVDPRAWLFGVAKNLVRRHWRTRHRERLFWERLFWERKPWPPPSATDGDIDVSVLSEDLKAAWKRLTPKERECLLLSVNHGLNDKAIADYQRTTRENVRQRRHRARWKLYEALGDVST